MREFTPHTITQAVVEQMATTTDPRMKEVLASAVEHLHAWAREVNLTPSEWLKGIEFMTKVGQACTPERQEFILLSDTLGLSTLVNTLHDKTALEAATHTSLLGPFFRENAPRLQAGAQISKRDTSEPMALWGKISDSAGQPIPHAQVSVWQTATDGRYDIQTDPAAIDCRGVFTTDAAGNYLIATVKPKGYYIPMDGPVGAMISAQRRHGMRPAHIHFLIGAPGYRELVTALYMEGDEHLADDVVFGASADLVAHVKQNDPNCPLKGMASVRFDFSLSRETEVDRRSGRVGADPSQILAARPPQATVATVGDDQTPAAARREKERPTSRLGAIFRGR
jgi:hydroxyquinol 1,2-dioxygenase